MRVRVTFLFVVAVLGVTGCFKSRPPGSTVDGDADADADTDGDTDGDGDLDCQFRPRPSTVDLLVLVDNSSSMAQEQQNLIENFHIFMQMLADPPYGAPADSLHVGVISTDMGTGGFAVQTCDDSIQGDDGILLHEPSGDIAGCDDSYPPYLSWSAGEGTDQITGDFGCIAALGTGGCGFEQHLKAVRKALRDHAGGANGDFLRDDSLLAILLLSDEEDCSIREDIANATDIFNTQLALGPLNLRCYNHRDQYVEPVDTFVEDLLETRDCPKDLAIFGIIGIPPGTRHQCILEDMTDEDYECLLNLPDMQEVIDNSAEGKGERLTPSCDEPGIGEAFPPRRLVETIRQIGNHGATAGVGSICESNFGSALRGIADALGPRIGQ